MVLLSPEELRSLTNRARRADQEAWLRERSIPFRWDGARLLVSRSMADQWLSGRELPVYREPDLSGVR